MERPTASAATKEALRSGKRVALAIDTNQFIGENTHDRCADLEQPWMFRLLTLVRSGQVVIAPQIWDVEIWNAIRRFVVNALKPRAIVQVPEIVSKTLHQAGTEFCANVSAEASRSEELATNLWNSFKRERQITVLPPPGNDCLPFVIERYLNQKSPFAVGSKDKKAEFPDAFAIVSIDEYARRESMTVVVVVSKDKGTKAFCKEEFPHLIVFDDAAEAIEALSSAELMASLADASNSISLRYGIFESSLSRAVMEAVQTRLAPFHQFLDFSILPGWQPRLTIKKFIAGDFIPHPLHNTAIHAEALDGGVERISGQIAFKCEIDFTVNAEDPVNFDIRSPLLVTDSEKTILVGFSAVHTTGTELWTVNIASISMKDTPQPPSSWTRRPIA